MAVVDALCCKHHSITVETLDSKRRLALWNVLRWFAVLNIFSSTVPVIGLLSLSIVKLGSEWVFAIRHRPSEQSHTILRQSSHGSLAFQTELRARSSLIIVADLCLLS